MLSPTLAVVRKEWQAFGHKFFDRIWGHKGKERSPVFFQFIETVWQVMCVSPGARPAQTASFAPRSVRRALLMPQVHPGPR